MRLARVAAAIGIASALAGCASVTPFKYTDPFGGAAVGPGQALEKNALPPELAQKILALDPEHVTTSDVRDVLSKAPAPRVINIHGGIFPVHLLMINFSEFLMQMGYPEGSLRNPRDGSFSYSCYFNARPIAGAVAWHYERAAMRPMLVGHSQGGIQVLKILHDLAGNLTKKVEVWNPYTGKNEKRDTITDPFTGQKIPVVGIQAAYATAVGSGGLTRVLPNQWVMNSALMRSVPDSAVEFTGFHMNMDVLGGDFMGFSPANNYNASGRAVVRNVQLPLGDHVTVPSSKQLALHAATKAWIDTYHPSENSKPPAGLQGPAANLMWATDVWYSIKKHWALELQNLVRHPSGTAASTPGPKMETAPVETVDRSFVRRRVLGRRVASRWGS